MNHYEWLEINLPIFFSNVGLGDHAKYCNSLLSAAGDKCYGYEHKWTKAGIPFPHGVALYLLTQVPPYTNQVRETEHGWVAPDQWVLDNYESMKQYLPAI